MSLGSRIILFSSLYFLGFFPPNYSWVCTILKIRREQSLLWKYLGHIIPHHLSGCKPSMNQSPFPFQIYFPWLPLVMSDFPPCHVCPGLPLPNMVTSHWTHVAQSIHKPSHFSHQTILKGGDYCLRCKERRGRGNGVFFTNLQFHPPFLPSAQLYFTSTRWVTWSKLLNFRKVVFSPAKGGQQCTTTAELPWGRRDPTPQFS